jgi:DNA-binding NtrC family response regulator
MTGTDVIRVLLVEDDEGSRRSTERFLRDSGLDVVSTPDGETAVGMIERHEPSVVVADYRLPGVDGIELIRRIKAKAPAIPCLMVTAHGDVQSAVEAMRAGAVQFIEKPVQPSLLLEMIREAREKHALRLEVEQLRRRLDKRYGFDRLIGSSTAMTKVFERIRLAAPSAATVLITGESGTGKELVAQAIHHNSPRRSGPFVAINCAALPANLVESELFGHERGAFTGATGTRKGYFEAAEGGTLLIDEVGDLPPPAQPKLLRALEQRVINRVGSTREVAVDVRIVAATHRPLEELVRERVFREDLFFRLSVVRIDLPPLRERREDVRLLTVGFLEQAAESAGKPPIDMSPEAMEALERHSWPGNVRELRNTIESIVVLCTAGRIELADLPEGTRSARPVATPLRGGESATPDAAAPRTLHEIERQAILDALRTCGGNRTHAAQLLGIGLRTIQRKLRGYGHQ